MKVIKYSILHDDSLSRAEMKVSFFLRKRKFTHMLRFQGTCAWLERIHSHGV